MVDVGATERVFFDGVGTGRRDLVGGCFVSLACYGFVWRIGISSPARPGQYDDEWEYNRRAGAVAAFLAWDPRLAREPPGWTRHPATGRKRVRGDPGREFRPDVDGPPPGFRHPFTIEDGWTPV